MHRHASADLVCILLDAPSPLSSSYPAPLLPCSVSGPKYRSTSTIVTCPTWQQLSHEAASVSCRCMSLVKLAFLRSLT